MTKLKAFAGLILIFTFVFHVPAQIDRSPGEHSTCGTPDEVEYTSKGLQNYVRRDLAPASELVLYLDFDGGIVVPGFDDATLHRSSIISRRYDYDPPRLSQAQIEEVVRLVRDDFSPFNIRVTTDRAEFELYPIGTREMCVVTDLPTDLGFPNSLGGVAPGIRIGIRNANAMAFAFSGSYRNEPTKVASIISHETGHLLGLGHQHLFSDTCVYIAEHYGGRGTDPLSFFPLMGNTTFRGITNWFEQSCLDPIQNLPQNDYELIKSQVNVRIDDYPDAPSGGRPAIGDVHGILERGGDIDYIPVVLRGSGVISVSSDNIDLKVSVVSPNGLVMEEHNDPGSANVSFPSRGGFKLLKIEAAINDGMDSRFMTGTYKVSH